MAETVSLNPELRAWLNDNITEDFSKALHLTMVESKEDPPEEPYRSMYAARELLSGIKAKMDSAPEELKQTEDYIIVSSCCQLEFGLNYINTDELSRGESALENSLQPLERAADKVKTASVCVRAYNELGVLWGNRSEPQKSLEYLLKAKAVYESHVALPPPLSETEWLEGKEVSEWEREQAFENLHTLTLFYLAQVYGNLNQAKLSAQYCQMTLSRQLETREYDAIEWTLNCATLSQYYLGINQYSQARHCLASASSVFENFRNDSSTEDERLAERIQRTGVEVSRCWTKYCIALLEKSVEKQEEEAQPEQPARHKSFKFVTLEVADLEAAVSSELVESYDGAKKVFLFAQKHISLSKEYYTLDNFASDHISIVQDHSRLYKLLAYFESASEVQCRMHKRRFDMLTGILDQLNPQYYLAFMRQMLYETAEIQSEMANLKMISASDSPSPHAVGKINKLLKSAITFYDKFYTTFLDPSTNELPEPVDEDCLGPILRAKFYTARLHSKIISPDSNDQVSFFFKSIHYTGIFFYCFLGVLLANIFGSIHMVGGIL